jgi:hypothetical protein
MWKEWEKKAKNEGWKSKYKRYKGKEKRRNNERMDK